MGRYYCSGALKITLFRGRKKMVLPVLHPNKKPPAADCTNRNNGWFTYFKYGQKLLVTALNFFSWGHSAAVPGSTIT